MSTRNYAAITDLDELRERIDHIYGDIFGFDIETGYLGADREKGAIHPETAIVVGFSFTNSTDWARYVPLAHDTGENINDHLGTVVLLWELLSTGLGVAHNAAFELRHLAKLFRELLSDHPVHGEKVRASRGYYPVRSDTQVEAYLMAEYQRFGLKALTKAMFDHQMTELHELFEDLPINRRRFLRFNTLEISPKVVEYACEDSVWCLAIHQRYYERCKEQMLYRVEMAIVQTCLPAMEDYGVAYDWAMMSRTAEELRLFRDHFNAEIMAELSELVGETVAINLASPPQIAKVLFDQLGYRTTVYTDKTRDLPYGERKMSTGSIALTKLSQKHPVVKKILQWKEMTKLLGTYLDKYEKVFNYADDGRAHPSHLSAFVVTGRFAVADPPYQGSPKKYHFDLAAARTAHAAEQDPPAGSCFVFNFRDVVVAPPEHYLLGFDLSQAELRAIAGEAQETALLKAFALGEDVHRLTASLMLGVALADVTEDQRDIGKTMNFALLYGMGVKSLADRLGIGIDEAQSLMDKYFAGYSNIALWSAKQVEHGRRFGFVTSRFGRRLPIWEYHHEKEYMHQKGDRACVNYPIQGAATGDYMKIAMVRAQSAIVGAGQADTIRLVMNIHDALQFYVHRSVDPQQVITLLKDAVVFPVPGWPAMKADWYLAKRWGSPLKIDIRDDGTLMINGAKTYELAPAVEVDDETGESVEVMPEVDREVLHAIAGITGQQRGVVLTLAAPPAPAQWATFVNLLDTLPGPYPLRTRTPEGDSSLPYTTGLTPAHLGEVARLFPHTDVELAWDTSSADTSEVTTGLTF